MVIFRGVVKKFISPSTTQRPTQTPHTCTQPDFKAEINTSMAIGLVFPGSFSLKAVLAKFPDLMRLHTFCTSLNDCPCLCECGKVWDDV